MNLSNTKKRTSTLVLLFLVTVFSSRAQLLFRISGCGMKTPSYMLGTIHVAPGIILERYDAYLDAEQKCQQLYVEYDVTDEQHRKHLQESGQQIATLPDSATIFDILGDERSKKLTEVMQESTHFNLNDSAACSMWFWQPLMFTNVINMATGINLLTQSPTLQKLQGDRHSGIMDATCIIRAKLHGWKVGELDKLAKQEELEKARKNMWQSIDVQVDSLMALLNNYEERKQAIQKEYEKIDKMALSWIKGDFDEFTGLMSSDIEKSPALFSERNKKWLPQIIEAMKEMPTLFVFGAGHMISSDGIVNLLREAGYEVEQIKALEQ